MNETDEFTSEDRATGLQAASGLAIKAVQDSASVSVARRSRPGTGTTATGTAHHGQRFATADPSGRCGCAAWRHRAARSATATPRWMIRPSTGCSTPSLAAIVGDNWRAPAWAGSAGTPHPHPVLGHGLTYSINTATLTTALAAIAMPGKTDGTSCSPPRR